MENNIGIQDAIDALILGLNEIFGDEYTYYPENIGQGMKLPCFFVQYINGNEDLLVGQRYSSKSHFVIHGHVLDDENKKKSLNDMASLLYSLEYIKLRNGDLLRLENREIKIEDNEVFFYCDINVHLIKKKAEEIINMQNINMNGGVKKNG